MALLLGDLLWAGLAIALAWWLVPDDAPDPTGGWSLVAAAALPLAWCLAAFLAGLYYLRPWRPAYLAVWDMLKAVAWGTATVAGLGYLLIPAVLPGRDFYALAGFGMWLLGSLARLVAVTVLPRHAFVQRYLLLGTGRRAAAMAEALREARGMALIGAVTLDGEVGGDAVPVIGRAAELPRLIVETGATNAVLCAENPAADVVARAATECQVRGVRVETMAGAYERITQRVPILAAGEEYLNGIESRPRTRYATRLKRLLDIAVSLALLPGALVILTAAAAAIKLTSPGAVFYTQTRVGTAGRRFAFVKLRTMVEGAELETGPVWAQHRDPRITPVGRVLRRWKVDELPQLWSVLRGEMSLVGPRPERPHFVEEFVERIPYYRLRLLVPPGISGWAQVHRGADHSEDDVYEKLRYDLYYVRHLSFALDLRVMARTMVVLLTNRPAPQV